MPPVAVVEMIIWGSITEFNGMKFPLILILDALISRIYALLQFLLVSPNLKVLFIEGIIFPLTEVRSGAALYACPFIVLTLKSFTYMLRHRFVKEPKSELLLSKGIIFPLILILVVLISRILAVLLVNCEKVQLLD